jgi:hypothetical protein
MPAALEAARTKRAPRLLSARQAVQNAPNDAPPAEDPATPRLDWSPSHSVPAKRGCPAAITTAGSQKGLTHVPTRPAQVVMAYPGSY